MAELHLDYFPENMMVTLKIQFETYIVDVRDVDDMFYTLKGLDEIF